MVVDEGVNEIVWIAGVNLDEIVKASHDLASALNSLELLELSAELGLNVCLVLLSDLVDDLVRLSGLSNASNDSFSIMAAWTWNVRILLIRLASESLSLVAKTLALMTWASIPSLLTSESRLAWISVVLLRRVSLSELAWMTKVSSLSWSVQIKVALLLSTISMVDLSSSV